jgi:hypothetical protein
MLPFIVEKLMMDFTHEMKDIKKDLPKKKYSFCLDFQREMNGVGFDYATMIFDYLFNLYFFRHAFGSKEFKNLIEDFKDQDFLKPHLVKEYLYGKKDEQGQIITMGQYYALVVKYKTHFMNYFGFNHDDPLYVARKIHDEKKPMRQKLMEYIE